jgi:hypothetical protein
VQIPLLGPRAAVTYGGRKVYVGMKVGVPGEVAVAVAARTTRSIEGTGAGAIVAHTGHSELKILNSPDTWSTYSSAHLLSRMAVHNHAFDSYPT